MDTSRKMLAAFLLLLCSFGAQAQLLAPPLSGFFWNPAEPGKGWALDVQDDLVFVAHYTFQPGSPASVFYTTVGRWDYVNRRFSGDLLEFTGGPCLTCGPRQSTPRSLGTATFQFVNRDQGSITFQGRTTPIVRFLFNYASESRSILTGVWHVTIGNSGVYFGDLLRITGPCTVSACSSIAGAFVGYIVDGGVQRVLVGGPVGADPNDILFVLDTSTSYYENYRFKFSLDFFAGTSNIYLKGTSPTGNGLPMFASRIAGGPNDATAIFGLPRAIGAQSGSKAVADRESRSLAMGDEANGLATPSTSLMDGEAVAVDDMPQLRAQFEAALAEYRLGR